MKKLIITMGLTLVASGANATTTETVAKEFNLVEEKGELDSADILHVIASCGNCDYSWKLRGVSQIIDIQG